MIIDTPESIRSAPLFYHLKAFLPDSHLYMKLEGLNIAGSIKLVSACGMVNALIASGKITPKTILVESSSGNLGVALSIVCKSRKIPFLCISDPNLLPHNERLIKAYGAQLYKVERKDQNGGFLGSRIAYIHQLVEKDPRYIWVNQYHNPENPLAYYRSVAREMLSEFERIDYLFIGAGTTGTLMGCAKYFREHSPATQIIGVDAMGSVTFNSPPKKRYIPGLGTSKRPAIVDEALVDRVIHVEEIDTIRMCQHVLGHHGLLLGGSSGTVLCGVKHAAAQICPGSVVMMISPDFGEKYLEMVYSQKWVDQHFTYKNQ